MVDRVCVKDVNNSSPVNRFQHKPVTWLLIGALVTVNVWYNYYHPLGIFFDAIIVIILLAKWSKS